MLLGDDTGEIDLKNQQVFFYGKKKKSLESNGGAWNIYILYVSRRQSHDKIYIVKYKENTTWCSWETLRFSDSTWYMFSVLKKQTNKQNTQQVGIQKSKCNFTENRNKKE